MYISCRILTAPVGRVWRLIAFSRRYAPKNTIRLPPLKNDGRVNCVSSKFLLGFCEKTAEWKPYAVPGHGEGGGEAVGRGKYEQKLKN